MQGGKEVNELFVRNGVEGFFEIEKVSTDQVII